MLPEPRRVNHPSASELAALLAMAQLYADPVKKRIAEQGQRPLSLHLSEYRAVLLARGNGKKHVSGTIQKIRLMLRLCKARLWAQLNSSAVQVALGKLGAERPRRKPRGPATVNAYLASLKGFCGWMVDDDRAERSPCRKVKRLNPRVDVRKVRRALTAGEVLRLVTAAQAGRKIADVSGPERATMYALACSTGLRSNEIQTLTKSSFVLDGPEPHVIVQAAYSKHRRRDVVPLRADMAALMRDYLASVEGDRQLFRRATCDNGMRALKEDLSAAGIPYRTDQGDADFHALRHTYCTNLLKSGCNPKELQSLARHETPGLTLELYSHADDAGKRAAVERLPASSNVAEARAAILAEAQARAQVKPDRFTENGRTWIAARALPADDLDVRPEGAELLLEHDRKLPRPRIERCADGVLRYLPRDELAARISKLQAEADRRRTGKPTRQQVEQLPRESWVGIEEAEAIGFNESYLRFHSLTSDPRVTPDAALGRLFAVAMRARLHRRRHVVLERTWKVGELLDSFAGRGTALDLPAGCVLVRDYAKRLKTTVPSLLHRIQSAGIPHRTCTVVKRNGSPQPSSYLRPEDLARLPVLPVKPPGWVRVKVAAAVTGLRTADISRQATAGRIKSTGRNRDRLVELASVEAWGKGWKARKIRREQERPRRPKHSEAA